MFYSYFEEHGRLELPAFSGVRIQLMPVVMHDAESLPHELTAWRFAFETLCALEPTIHGTAYLTIDQRFVLRGEYHRRPGLHVDGAGVWGASGWGGRGMYVVSDVEGCAAWIQPFHGAPLEPKDPGDPDEGNCEHLRAECKEERRSVMNANRVYRCDAMCVHESLPMKFDCLRTFVRLSLPNEGVWPSNCTPNPKGIQPNGVIGTPRRTSGRFTYEV